MYGMSAHRGLRALIRVAAECSTCTGAAGGMGLCGGTDGLLLQRTGDLPLQPPRLSTTAAFTLRPSPPTLTTFWLQPLTMSSSSKATLVTRPVWPCSVAMRRPVVWLHSRTALPSALKTFVSSTCRQAGRQAGKCGPHVRPGQVAGEGADNDCDALALASTQLITHASQPTLAPASKPAACLSPSASAKGDITACVRSPPAGMPCWRSPAPPE
jgi:hypothetical protein